MFMSGTALGSLVNDNFEENEEKENEVEELGKPVLKLSLQSYCFNESLASDEDFVCNEEESEVADDKSKQAKQPVWKRPQKKKAGKKQSGVKFKYLFWCFEFSFQKMFLFQRNK